MTNAYFFLYPAFNYTINSVGNEVFSAKTEI